MLTSTSFAGTLTTAAQSAITSLGTLTSLGISGNLTVDTNTLHVDATNNRVGIGTTAPTSIFHVAGADAPQIKVQDTDTAGGYAHFKVNNAALYIESFDEDGTEGEIIFENASSEAMRIDTSGRLLLGTATAGEGSADDLTIATLSLIHI